VSQPAPASPAKGNAGRDRALAWLATGAVVTMLATLTLLFAAAVVRSVGAGGAQHLGSSLLGSLTLALFSLAIALPLGIAAAATVSESQGRGKLIPRLDLFLSSMASLPSIVYGLAAAQALLLTWHLHGLVTTVLALATMVAPFVYVTARESFDAVPRQLREGAYALGAEPWEVFRRVVFPVALPGILTGSILSVAKVVSETAILLIVATLASRSTPPDTVDALPLTLVDLVRRPIPAVESASLVLLVLLAVVVALNAAAIYLRSSRPLPG